MKKLVINFIRKLLFKVTGVNSISVAISPIYYVEKLIFNLFFMINGKQIISGKFQRLSFENSNRGSEFRPKYFGTYEDELDSFFLKFRGSILIDIGSDDGYYSIGLLKNLYVNKVFAFEINEKSISNFKKNLKLNSIDAQEINLAERFVSDFESIKDCFNTTDKFLIKCDIEGGEYQLFTDEMIKSISKFNVSLIIETHINYELESLMISRFLENKFKVEIIEKFISKRWRGEIGMINNFLLGLFGKYWLNEHRPLFNRWIVVSNN